MDLSQVSLPHTNPYEANVIVTAVCLLNNWKLFHYCARAQSSDLLNNLHFSNAVLGFKVCLLSAWLVGGAHMVCGLYVYYEGDQA